ncbi:MAG: SRPBCC domain-containing protein [Thermomicrobiales bacterium]|nr:SRPBCC domain-containing protein [Thermomicrobiales bacterium]
MEELQYTIEIDAPRQKVWDFMLGKETYPQWTEVAWPGGVAEGDWKAGTEMRFGGEGGGTVAKILTADRPSTIRAEHTAVINEDGSLDRESEMARSWIGSREAYDFVEKDGKTELTVRLAVPAEWQEEFDSGWPKALDSLKELVEAS